jgi:hypothetical protein
MFSNSRRSNADSESPCAFATRASRHDRIEGMAAAEALLRQRTSLDQPAEDVPSKTWNRADIRGVLWLAGH